MNSRLLVLVAAASLSIAPSACSSSDKAPAEPQTEDDLDWNTPHPITLRQDAVLTPHAVSDTVVLQENAVVIPTTGANMTAVNGWIGKLAVGNVIAGDRDTRGVDGSTNATGFLRRIVAIDRQADKIVIATRQAFLNELIEDGDVVFDSSNPTGSIFDQLDGVTMKTQSLHPLNATGQTASGSGSTSEAKHEAFWEPGSTPNVGLTGSFEIGKVALNAKADGTLKFRKWWKIPTGVERAELKVELEPEIEADFDVGVGAGRAFSATHAKAEQIFATVPIPLGGPLPLNLRIEPGFGITFTASGAITVHGKVTAKGSVAAGFKYEDGALVNTSEGPTFDSKWDFTQINGKAQFALEAGPFVGIKLLAFDALGMEGKVGAYGQLLGEVCDIYDLKTGERKQGFDVKARASAKFEMNALAQIPFLDKEIGGIGLFSVEWPTPEWYIIGSKQSCEFEQEAKDAGADSYVPADSHGLAQEAKTEFLSKDSCVGRDDGIYCSQLFEGSAIVCKNQQITYGLQCPSPQKCTGPNGAGTTIYCDGKPLGGGGGGGDAGTIADSCNGKADGLYCSTLSPTAAYECKGGSTAGGQQCPTGKTCAGPNGAGSTIVCN